MSFNRNRTPEKHASSPEEGQMLVTDQDQFPPSLQVMGVHEAGARPIPLETLAGEEVESNPWLAQVQPQHRADALLILRDQPQAFESYIRLCYLPDPPENILNHFDATFFGTYEKLEHWAEDYFDMMGRRRSSPEAQR